jgi:Protein of unknown function, DUF547
MTAPRPRARLRKWTLATLALVAAILLPLAASAAEDNKAAAGTTAAAADAKAPPAEPIRVTPTPERGPIGKPEDFDAILKHYVKGDYFDYKGLKANPADRARFESFLRWQAGADVSRMSRPEQIAFYINAYNACSIKAVLDHYPVHTPLDVEGFFDRLQFQVAGEWLKLGGSDGDSMEYDRLIRNYRDMRAHFAVVCADRGCLPLKPGAYHAETLDRDLDAAARKFVTDERHFKVIPEQREVHVSKIFEWYGPKFLNDPDRPVKADRPELYLLNWIKDPETRKLLESGEYELKIIEWSWTLNEK